MFREIVEHSIDSRGLIADAGTIHALPSNYCRYKSLFMFGPDVQQYIKTHLDDKGKHSIRGYSGKCYADAVWIDIDADGNIEGAKEATIQVVKRLSETYLLNPDYLYIFFSGNKGFHICLHHLLIGFPSNEAIEPKRMKDFVKRLCEGIPHVDADIYYTVSIFRIENSQHEKTGLYKTQISYDELHCEGESIKTLCKKPREKYPYTTDKSGFGKNERLASLWLNCGSYAQEQAAVIETNGNLFEPPPQGSRNKTLLIQACTLFRKSELSKYAIRDIVWNAAQLANIGATDNIDFHEVKRIVDNAERLVGDERKKSQAEELNIKSFGEWIPEWENYVLQQQTNMSLVFSDLNRLMRGKLKGKLGVIMGYGGSKKSLYALNVALRNINENGEIAIYSTMEMSAPQLINRIIDHEVTPFNPHNNASTVIENLYKNNVLEGRKYLNDLAKKLGNKLQIVSNSRMTYEYYKLAIQKVKETTGTPTILVVDGLSMMGGKKSETDNYSDNSAALKELANEENMLVLLICHVSKGAEKDKRDLAQNIRGSEKILDNCDFYMTMSQVREDANMEVFNPLKGFVNFNDKRGSGQTANLVFDFNTSQLQLIQSNEDPRPYMESRTRKSKYQESDF